jgi:ATP-dependent Clp protease ATP-binding subunit ClpX
VLFICGGAFDGISKMIASRLNTKPIGFANTIDPRADILPQELLGYVTAQDLKSFGLIPELIGRLPVVSYLNPLDANALRRILIEPRNAIVKQYQKLFKMEGVTLEFADSGIEYIVEKAMEFNLGARGLRSICEAILTDAMFEIPSMEEKNQLSVDRAYAEAKISKSKYAKRMMVA